MKQLGKNILYVDDEPQNLEGFEFIFHRDFNIFTAADGIKALDIIRNNEIKVLISDQKMPGMTGLELIAQAKEEYPDIVCIILTAYADLEAIIQAVNQGGVYRYMMKPWDEPDLRLSINRALERYAYKKENQQLLSDIQNKNKELEKYNNELKDTIEELRAAKEKAEESDRLKQAFLQNISHEIRTPMNGILGFADLLKTPNLNEKAKSSYIATINSSGQQLMSIIENVLDIAKIEAGQVELNITQFDLNYLIKDISNFHSLQLDKTNVAMLLENPYQDQPVYIETDSVKLRQILDNLLNNAQKFTPSGSITLKLFLDDNEILFIVEDTGIGIAQDKLDSIFKPFHQVDNDNTRTKSGTGLGLSITKSYIELLGGHIKVQSETGKGSKFYISLPLPHANNTANVIKNTSDKKLYFENNDTILIVEDDEVSYNYIDTLLRQMNLKTYWAPTGREALDFFNYHHEIDLILMDLKLPDISGLETTKKLRSNGVNQPIIAQTSHALSNVRDEALEAGCNDFITKPLLKGNLYEVIFNQLNN